MGSERRARAPGGLAFARPALRIGLLLGVALAPACSRESAPAPQATASASPAAASAPAAAPSAPAAASSSAPGPMRAIIEGPRKDGRPQRGIVRAQPSFSAPEVTRLETGTAVVVAGVEPGGWYRIRWPYPDGTDTGFLHRDVLRDPTRRKARPAGSGARADDPPIGGCKDCGDGVPLEEMAPWERPGAK